MGADRRCRLYLLTPPAFQLPDFAEPLARALDAGDVAAVQLRLKPAEPDAIKRAASALRRIVQERDVAFIINDLPEIARETGADGVHLGPDDMPYEAARRIVGPDAIVGVSCKASRHAAMVAAEKGASYVAFGAFYDSATKSVTAGVDAEILEWWSALMEVPSVAIGGITPANCVPLVKGGADFICACSSVWGHAGGSAAAVREFNQRIDEALA